MSDLGRYLAFWPMPRGRANRCIDAGDAARNVGAWEQAAFHYRRAVAIQPRRRPIWIQLGHAEKEVGRPQAALDAYAKASLLPGEDGEAALHHGLQAKALGLHAQAKASFERAFRENPAHPGARGEWQVMLHHPLAANEEDKAAAASLLQGDRLRLEAAARQGADQGTPLIFEVTDLLRHFRNARLPTGVQRVQMEVICAAIPRYPGSRICCFTGSDEGWVLIPVEQFQALCALALADGDMFEAEWIRAVEVLAASLALAVPVGFGRGDALVNLGTSWILPNYFLYLRHAKRSHGIRYVPFVHDVIPVVAPQYCLPDVVQDYLGWIGGVFDHADRFLTNSRSTASDLRYVAGLLGHRLNADDVTVVTLDAAVPNDDGAPLSALEQWRLEPGGFVLFVSSIEPRKNHMMAFRAWQAMIARDAAGTPDLICVGNGGWLNGPIHAMLQDDPGLANKVQILSDVSDEELALLYRQCRLTIYPSHYEGWGMPVTEALCHGKVPVVTRCSSLTEAGGDFAVYVTPDDAVGLAETIQDLWLNPERLAALEARIASDFHPRSWMDLAVEIGNACQHHGEAATQEAPKLRPDTLYRLGSNRATRLVPGSYIPEMVRQGLGWEALEAGQCRTSQSGGALGFGVADGYRSLFCHLKLAGPQQGAPFVRVGPDVYPVPTSGWISCEVPITDGRGDLWLSGGMALTHLVVSDSADLVQVATRIVDEAGSDHACLRDIYPLMAGREAELTELAEFLPALDAGGLTRADVLSILKQQVAGAGG
jgi:glycosyltransferase involved in cell wall biosynthesis